MDSVGTLVAHPWGPTGHQPTVIAGVGGKVGESVADGARERNQRRSDGHRKIFRISHWVEELITRAK